ncbi:MAG: DUF4956 domain-containing protein [Clostridia bacterium]|nr:DUF4956 domain-containing protein [Clostridia bacterium]
MFTSIIDSTASALTVSTALICTGVSVLLGVLVALCYRLCSKTYTKNFLMTLVLLPVLVQSVIMMVSGSLGAGVAVMGTFSLVRFRSTPGTSKEIAAVFCAMALGLATGMGQVVFAVCLAAVVCLLFVALGKTNFGEKSAQARTLKIVIPESLAYTEVFSEIFDEFTASAELDSVKTTNMGSLYELKYEIKLKKDTNEKAFIDALRCRNGNLNISLARPVTSREEL